MKCSQDKNEILLKPIAKRIMMNTLKVKPCKTIDSAWEILDIGLADRSKHFSTTIPCFIIDCILYVTPFVQGQSTCKQTTSILVEMKGERLPITSSKGLWVLFDFQIAFHNRKSNIGKFSFFHVLIFENKKLNNTLQIYQTLQMIYNRGWI